MSCFFFTLEVKLSARSAASQFSPERNGDSRFPERLSRRWGTPGTAEEDPRPLKRCSCCLRSRCEAESLAN